MSEKLTLKKLNTLANHESALHSLNDNFNDIANKIDTLLSRDGDIPNYMLSDIDLNHYDLINVSSLEVDVILLGGEDLLSNYYTKTESDSLLSGKSAIDHTHSWGQISGIPDYIISPSISNPGSMTDVDVSDKASWLTGFVLTYNATSNNWVAQAQSGSGGGIDHPASPGFYISGGSAAGWINTTLENQTDVQYDLTLEDNDVLVYDFTNSYWTNKKNVVFDIESPTTDAQYIYKNNEWAIYDSSTHELDNMLDVAYVDETDTPIEPAVDQILKYTKRNNINGQWEPFDVSDVSDVPIFEDNTYIYGNNSDDSGSTWTWKRVQPYDSSILAHIASMSNPHGVTAVQVGADPSGSASTVQTNLQTHLDDQTNPHSVTAVQVGADPLGSASTVQTNLQTHLDDQTNPHDVTYAQVVDAPWDEVTGGINYAGGNVGIGTDDPLSRLHLSSGSLGINGWGGGLQTEPALELGYYEVGTRAVIRAVTGGSTYHNIGMGVNAHTTGTQLMLLNSGNVGIGTHAPNYKLEVNGALHAVGDITSGGACCSSDINLKHEVNTMSDALDVVNKLRGVRFKWKDGDRPDIGIIAQELEEELPELVREFSNIKHVNYNGVTAMLVEAIKQLSNQVKKLEAIVYSG